MSHDWTDNRKNLMLFSGRAHPELADQVAKELDIHVTAQTARDFANGEIFVRFDESVRGCDAFVLQSHPAPLNQWFMEQLIMIDALKRGSAKRITAVLPFYPYARQDKKHRGREPISARLVADLLKTAGADRIVTVSDGEIAAAMRHYFSDTHNVAEGAGAAPLAALLQEGPAKAGGRVGLILSGGNIDRGVYAGVLAG